MKRTKKLLVFCLAAFVLALVLSGAWLLFQKPSARPEELPEPQVVATEQENAEVISPEEPKAEEPSFEKSKTEALPEDEPKETQTVETSAEAESVPEIPTCTLSVRCDDVLGHMDKLNESKRGIIPGGGFIFPEQAVSFQEGDSVFDVLLREMRQNGIHLEYVQNPMYQSAYIEGIGNLYEFDCGDTSGWLYKVNGVKPNYGCSKYKVTSGDKIEFFYQCNMFN